jgi:hypothetical protein
MENDDKEFFITRPEPFFRMQKKSEYIQMIGKEKYRESKQIEVRYFAIYGKKLFNKTGAECRNIWCLHLREPNKGYPVGFTNYLTFDEKYERNIRETIERRKRRN